MVKCITWSILLQCSVLKGSFQVDATSYTPLTQTQLQSIYTSSWQHSPMAGRWGLRGSDLGNRCLITLGIWRPVWFLNIFFVAWIGSIVKLGGGGPLHQCLGGWFMTPSIHVNSRTQGLPADHCILTRWSMIFTSPVQCCCWSIMFFARFNVALCSRSQSLWCRANGDLG